MLERRANDHDTSIARAKELGMELQDAFAYVQKFSTSSSAPMPPRLETPSGQSAAALVLVLKECVSICNLFFSFSICCSEQCSALLVSLPLCCAEPHLQTKYPDLQRNRFLERIDKEENSSTGATHLPFLVLPHVADADGSFADFRRQFLKANSELSALDMAAKKAADQIKQIRQMTSLLWTTRKLFI